jgi:hypothetical protein
VVKEVSIMIKKIFLAILASITLLVSGGANLKWW